jgi:hypothetical protein
VSMSHSSCFLLLLSLSLVRVDDPIQPIIVVPFLNLFFFNFCLGLYLLFNISFVFRKKKISFPKFLDKIAKFFFGVAES